MYHTTHGGPSRAPHTAQRPPPSSHGRPVFNPSHDDDDRLSSMTSDPPDYLTQARLDSSHDSYPHAPKANTNIPLTHPTGDRTRAVLRERTDTNSMPGKNGGRPPSYPPHQTGNAMGGGQGMSPTYDESAHNEQSARAAASERQNRRTRYRRGGSEEQLAMAAQEQMMQARGAAVVDVNGERTSPTKESPTRRPHRAERDGQEGQLGPPRQQRQGSVGQQHLQVNPNPNPQPQPRSSASEASPTNSNSASGINRTPSRGVVASVLQPLGKKCDEYDGLMAAAQADMARLDAELAALAEQRAAAEGRYIAAKGKHDDYRRQYADVERALTSERPRSAYGIGEGIGGMGMPSMSAPGMGMGGGVGVGPGMAQRQASMGRSTMGRGVSATMDRPMSMNDLGPDSDDEDLSVDGDEEEERPRPRHVFGEKKPGAMARLRKSFFGGS